ncbi:hypothetical protein Mal4_39420 [Maioricimonas rarisocia]|uniref:Uncharacterized protein n=1 Tax=Maioricimonas rarisocia TaxID=2528026 RepID=A0A517ZAR5_9PLAN|nr:Tm-1-like ATP-binding domain-containing protein [Maioricimonas rarisocia]QDU39596.1 hypothetical protein Mal4_39420 [Maioricimonas rarisocia]
MTPAIYAVATMDTKGEELAYVADCLRTAGASVRMVDVGTLNPPSVGPDITRETVAGQTLESSAASDRGEAVTTMGTALRDFLVAEHAAGRVQGVIGIGGSGGTALITKALRALPIGLPKVMVSTVASGNTAGYVDCSDITMMPSVVDVAGLNAISKCVLSNAANAIAGMVNHRIVPPVSRNTLGMTMFGVTTPCVNLVRESLEQSGYDSLVFHATGIGGRAMEQLVESDMIQGVLDITTTEVADELVGGVFACGPNRFRATIEKQIPCVLSFGALDMVNFGARETVPEAFSDRLLHVHNEQITLMRTTADENREFARWMAARLGKARAPLVVLIPEGGVSLLDAPGMPFHDPEADAALFDTFESSLPADTSCRVVRVPHNINDPEFARAVVEHYLSLDRSGTATLK